MVARFVRPALALVLAVGAGHAVPSMVVVPGAANPNLAGRADGYVCCVGDNAPAHAPILVTGLSFSGGDRLTFSATGSTSVGPGLSTGIAPGMPDGTSGLNMTNYGDGISAPTGVRVNALMGVFLDPTSPTGQPTPPSLVFGNLGFSSLAPDLGQIFFIGDGRTTLNEGPAAGSAQEFLVPSGATRLFLGASDGFGWYNNSGDFTVDISRIEGGGPTVIPLPPSALLFAAGFAALGLSGRRRLRRDRRAC